MLFSALQKEWLLVLNFRKTWHRFFGGEGFIMQKLEGDGLLLYMQADM